MENKRVPLVPRDLSLLGMWSAFPYSDVVSPLNQSLDLGGQPARWSWLVGSGVEVAVRLR